MGVARHAAGSDRERVADGIGTPWKAVEK